MIQKSMKFNWFRWCNTDFSRFYCRFSIVLHWTSGAGSARVHAPSTWISNENLAQVSICWWGACENPQKSVNRPDSHSTLRFHGCSPKMRSGVWIRPISRFFRKFADGEPENLEKWEKWINNDSKII